jgi:hypothetical protein
MHVLEAKFYKLSIFLFDDFYSQNGGNIQDGVFQIFMLLFKLWSLL